MTTPAVSSHCTFDIRGGYRWDSSLKIWAIRKGLIEIGQQERSTSVISALAGDGAYIVCGMYVADCIGRSSSTDNCSYRLLCWPCVYFTVQAWKAWVRKFINVDVRTLITRQPIAYAWCQYSESSPQHHSISCPNYNRTLQTLPRARRSRATKKPRSLSALC